MMELIGMPHTTSDQHTRIQQHDSPNLSTVQQENIQIVNDLTKEDLELFRQTFASIDVNGDGYIDREELKIFMSQLSASGRKVLDDEQVTKALNASDVNGDGMIDFYEFVGNAIRSERSSTDLDDEIRQAFNFFDKDGNGHIDRSEIRRLMRLMGVCVRAQHIDKFFSKYDTDGNGLISFHEFKQFYQQTCI